MVKLKLEKVNRDVELDNFPDDISDKDSGIKINKLTALHIRFLAIDAKYQKRHLGTTVLQMAILRIKELSDDWPIRVITIDARCDLVHWYEREGFKKMPINTSGQDGVTVAMYYGLLKNNEELQSYIEEMYEV